MISGGVYIGGICQQRVEKFDAINPVTGELIKPAFSKASREDVAAACEVAERAAILFADLAPDVRAAFLETIAQEIVGIGDPLIVRAMEETGLPRARLEGERSRTIGQLRLFAQVLREGSWVGRTIDLALPERAPLPRPDLRLRKLALGPVAVFGASNFPLAFSVAGGDTASALAAGCPVVVKGHPAHPGTGELVALAIVRAVKACGLPDGVFSYLPGPDNALGSALVEDPRIKAVGFTGSRAGGLALVRIAFARHEPIPVYAEMSSINPVILFPAALRNRGSTLATSFIQSLTMGAGQFCTNPGVLIAIAGEDLDAFVASAADALTSSAAAPMLSPGIHGSFIQALSKLAAHSALTEIARGQVGEGVNQAQGALFRTTGRDFLADAALGHEVFGPSSIIVAVDDMTEIPAIIAALEGQLTATLLLDLEDEALAVPLIPLLERKVGRILVNGWPTGVEVSHAMVHGGPFPATSDSRSTSVGATAIERFLRPICYQALPSLLLPAALADANPWNLPERVNGELR